MFRVVELVLHYKWHLVKTHGKKKTRREDYDIALVRLDYPAIDEFSGKSPFFFRLPTIENIWENIEAWARPFIFISFFILISNIKAQLLTDSNLQTPNLIKFVLCHIAVSPPTPIQQVLLCFCGTSTCLGQSPLPSDHTLCRPHLPGQQQVPPQDCDANMFTNQWQLPRHQQASHCSRDRL